MRLAAVSAYELITRIKISNNRFGHKKNHKHRKAFNYETMKAVDTNLLRSTKTMVIR